MGTKQKGTISDDWTFPVAEATTTLPRAVQPQPPLSIDSERGRKIADEMSRSSPRFYSPNEPIETIEKRNDDLVVAPGAPQPLRKLTMSDAWTYVLAKIPKRMTPEHRKGLGMLGFFRFAEPEAGERSFEDTLDQD